MKDIDIQIVPFDSVLQKKSVELRYKILREPLGLVYTPEQLADEQDEIHIVALTVNEVIGVVVLKKMDAMLLKMRQVAIAGEYQGKGIGREMVRFSEVYAAQHGFRKIELHARDTAKEFYLGMEYKLEGAPFIEVGILHYKMFKDIL